MKIFLSCLLTVISSTAFSENQSVNIQSEPSNAAIYLNGLNSNQHTPSILNINEKFVVTIKKTCYEDYTFKPTEIKSRMTAKLKPLADVCADVNAVITAVVISSKPSGSKIFVNGEDTGNETPSVLREINKKSIIVLKKPGYKDCTISEIKTRSVSCDLKR